MIEVREHDFDIGFEYKSIRKIAGDAGAIVTFSGLVREFYHPGTESKKSIETLLLEHYPGMTEKALQKIESDARERWDLLDVRIIHRVGLLKPQDQIVFVGTASAHRLAAFESASFIMDFLKSKAPFWKKEKENDNGEGQWVQSRDTDVEAIRRWSV